MALLGIRERDLGLEAFVISAEKRVPIGAEGTNDVGIQLDDLLFRDDLGTDEPSPSLLFDDRPPPL